MRGRSGSEHDLSFLLGGGEMGERMRRFDWPHTSLGAAERWPQSLKTSVRIMLTSRQPMFVWWGDELVNLYNDAYKTIVGGKHPACLGQPAAQVWREIWDQVGPRAATAMRDNEGTYDEGLLLIMERNGYPEETYYTFSYSPVPNDEGGTGGILCANSDHTQQIVSERQLALLRELAASAAEARTVDEACALSAAALAADRHDLPFTLLYTVERPSGAAVLAGSSGVPTGSQAAPRRIAQGDATWPIADIFDAGVALPLRELDSRWPGLPRGPWKQPVRDALGVPIPFAGRTDAGVVLIAGLSPVRQLDDGYHRFLDLVAGQIASNLGRARAYAAERQRATELAELDRAKTVFFSNVSHEFRTPLTLLLGPLDDLLQDPANEAQQPLLRTMQRNAQRLLRLVNTLLDFSRIEAGRVEASFEPVELGALTEELASAFRDAMERAGLELAITTEDFGEPVYVDRDMWEKVVLNLLSNAFKYTLAGTIRVALAREGDSAVLRVADTGAGIPPSEVPKLFNRFHRVPGTRGRTHEGTGIGLALVAELVRLHGGSVAAESELGRGSEFSVRIPFGSRHLPSERVAKEPSAAERPAGTPGARPFVAEAMRWLGGDEALVSESARATRALAGGPRGRVLLADDNPDMREYVRRLLAPHFEVVAVADGVAALDQARAARPDLVLADVMMPRMDGFELLAALRAGEETRDVPVLLLSARAGEESRIEGLQAGADDYLIKPFSARELVARVSSSLALAKARREAAGILRESEERFTQFMRHFPGLAWIKDLEGRYVFVNQATVVAAGVAEHEILGRRDAELMPPDQAAACRESDLSALAGTGSVQTVETRSAGDEQCHYLITKFAIPGPLGENRLLGAMATDITPLRRAESELREADRRKDEFLATLAHELRNPLAPIQNGLQILELAQGHGETVERARAMMERQLGQMVRLIDDLLDLSRISRGRIELRRGLVDLKQIVDAAVETSRPLIEQAGHRFSVTLPAEALTIDADPTRMAQVISNLLNNSARYTDRGGSIELIAERRGGEVVLRVRDNGMGIPAGDLHRVFEIFTQLERPAGSPGGLGIGLSIVRQLVAMHGGSVSAHSAGPGQGSEFTVVLPLAERLRDRRTDRSRRARPRGPSLRILIADDNADAASSMGMMLEMLGHAARIAHDGEEALAVGRQFLPQLVMLDLGMPRLDGYECCRVLREEPWGAAVSVVALTGWGQDEDQRRTRAAGFDAHLVKPVSLENLERVIADAARRSGLAAAPEAIAER
jgi:PAS domain S-box-containing protein